MDGSISVNPRPAVAQWIRIIRWSTVIWGIAAVGFLACVPILWMIYPWLIFWLALFAAAIALPSAWIVLKLRKSSRHLGAAWARVGLATTFVLGMLIGLPILGLAAVPWFHPELLPRAVLTNGSRTIIFQGMMHVGTPRFYTTVAQDAEQALRQGYVIFDEGVRSNSVDDDDWVDGHLLSNVDVDKAYPAAASLCGLQSQGDFFSRLHRAARARDAYTRADVDVGDIRAEYDRLSRTDPTFAASIAKEQGDKRSAQGTRRVVAKTVAFAKSATWGQREITAIACQAVMSFVSNSAAGSHRVADRILVDFRNRMLARRLVESRYKRTYVIYGAGHFEGVLGLLRRNNPHWHIADLRWLRVW